MKLRHSLFDIFEECNRKIKYCVGVIIIARDKHYETEDLRNRRTQQHHPICASPPSEKQLSFPSSASPTPTWGDAFSVDNSAVITPSSSLPTSDAAAPSLAVDTSSPIPSNVVTSDVTVISGIQSVVASRSASFDTNASTQSVTGTSSAESTQSATSSGTAAVEATGAAVPVRGFKKMGLAGAIAGAAGVMFV